MTAKHCIAIPFQDTRMTALFSSLTVALLFCANIYNAMDRCIRAPKLTKKLRIALVNNKRRLRKQLPLSALFMRFTTLRNYLFAPIRYVKNSPM